MRVLQPLVIFFIFLSLIACAGSLSQKQVASIQTVGIINHFPDYPNYAQVGISIHKKQYPTVNDSNFRRTLSNEIAERLRHKGYQVKENDSGDAADVDLLIEIFPTKVDSLINSFAYGFYHRSLLGVVDASYSYIGLNLVTTLKGNIQCDDCMAESVSKLDAHGWRSNWIELPGTEKDKLEKALNSNIKIAVEKAFSQTGL